MSPGNVPSLVSRVAYRGDQTGRVPRSVQASLDEANGRARDAAKRSLLAIYPSACLGILGDYFTQADIRAADRPHASQIALEKLLGDICRLPRPMASILPTGLDIVAKTAAGSGIDPSTLGMQMELDSKFVHLLPERVWDFVDNGGSLELRQFDRTCSDWGWIADDVARLSHADVYVKLFLAGGSSSVNGRHHDATDVLATTLAGSKSFRVWGPSSNTNVEVSVSGSVTCGSAAVIPRGADHEVTPDGSVSALLSAGLMRMRDWSYRGAIPTHLGFNQYPSSPVAYALTLRSHLPLSPWRPVDGGTGWLASRAVGGLFVNEVAGGRVTVSACGSTFEMDAQLSELLLEIHGASQMPTEQLADGSNRQLVEGLRWLTTEGVVGHVDELRPS